MIQFNKEIINIFVYCKCTNKITLVAYNFFLFDMNQI